MKVAMLVHNPVVGDARVRKEARSLKNAGYDIDLFGYGDPDDAPETIEDCKLTIARKSPAVNFYTKVLTYVRKNSGKIRKLVSRKAIKNEMMWSRFLTLSFVLLSAGYSFSKGWIDTVFWSLVLFSVAIELALGFALRTMTKLEIASVLVFAGAVFLGITFPQVLIPGLMLILLLFGALVILAFLVLRNTDIVAKFQQRIALPAAHNHIAAQLVQNVDIKKYDIIHAHDVIALMAAVRLKKRRKQLKIVWDAHELYPELNYKTENGRAFMRKVITAASGYVDFFITINESFVDYYRSEFPKLPAATVLMNAARSVSSSSIGKSPLREASGISDEQFVLLFQGGLSFDRGVEFLLDAAEDMPKHWSIIFMGNGPLVDQVREKMNELNSKRDKGHEAIACIPPAPYHELARWTAGADLGVIPYRDVGSNHRYCTPNKLWEYPNAEIPILASGMVEMSRMIEKYGTGILLPREFTVADIVQELEHTDRARLDDLVENCRQFNKEEHWEKYEKRLVNLYQEISE